MTRKLKAEYEKWGLLMNTEKRQYLIVGEETTDLILENNKRIKKCNRYKYVGIIFNEEGTDDTEIKSRINKAKQIIISLNGLISMEHRNWNRREEKNVR